MPDWVHAILYILIVATTAYLAAYYTQNALGMIAGIGVGHFLASAIVKRLPGFWGS